MIFPHFPFSFLKKVIFFLFSLFHGQIQLLPSHPHAPPVIADTKALNASTFPIDRFLINRTGTSI